VSCPVPVPVTGPGWCCQCWNGDVVPDAGYEPECEGGEGRFCIREKGNRSRYGGPYEEEREREEGRWSYGSENATEDEAETVYVSVVVRIVFHGRRWVLRGLGSVLRHGRE
jgi:hypothetical protein